MAQIVRFPMPRPKICRTVQECNAVDPSLPIQVELVFDPVLQAELFAAEDELVLMEKLVLAKKRLVEQLRRLTYYGGYRPETVKAPLG
jgi:hypothetical protein